jgi:hypothetical protein
MNRARLRRYTLRVLAAASVGAVLLVGIGVANAGTDDTSVSGPDTVTVVRVIHPGGGTVSTQDTTWG